MNKLLIAYKKPQRSSSDHHSRYEKDLSARWVKASGEGNIEEMQTLVAGGADVNCCKDQGTPLMLAAFHRQTRAVKFLLENGAEVNLQDRLGQTALHQVVKSCIDHESLNTAQLLLDSGADANLQDRDGRTALHRVIVTCGYQVAEILLKGGADPKMKDHEGHTPMDVAIISQGCQEIRQLLNTHMK